jgi:hypothetical protein
MHKRFKKLNQINKAIERLAVLKKQGIEVNDANRKQDGVNADLVEAS